MRRKTYEDWARELSQALDRAKDYDDYIAIIAKALRGAFNRGRRDLARERKR